MPAVVPELIEALVRHFAAQRSEKHGVAPSRCARINWRHLLPRHANVHVVVILLRRRRRRSWFGSRNHRFEAVSYPLAPGVRVADAGAIPVALIRYAERDRLWIADVHAFPRHIFLALRVAPLLVALLATNETLVVLVPTVPLCFHPSGLGTLDFVGFVSSIAL